ncbi:IS1634 family transposase, partial [Vibrio vulnificus]
YGKVNQRWLLVHSEQATKREEITFFKNLEANIAKEIKALRKLSKKPFACEVDAELAFNDFKKQCDLLGFEQGTLIKLPTYSHSGR